MIEAKKCFPHRCLKGPKYASNYRKFCDFWWWLFEVHRNLPVQHFFFRFLGKGFLKGIITEHNTDFEKYVFKR